MLIYFLLYYKKYGFPQYDLQKTRPCENRFPRFSYFFLLLNKLYLDIDAKDELDGRIKAQKLVEEKTPYNIEFITCLSDKHLEYEKESGNFTITEL